MIVDVLRMATVTEVRRERRLPFPGNILVSLGDPVKPEDVVAEASIPSKVITLDIAAGLSVPISECSACMIRSVGEDVAEGDILAQCEGALPRLVRTPISGKIIEFREGKLVLAAGETKVHVLAGMAGNVVDLVGDTGVIIMAQGRIIQGVWGNGHIGAGKIRVVEDSWGTPLTLEMLDNATEASILCAGVCLDASVLTHLPAAEISGLVLGVLAPHLIAIAAGLPFPVMVLQGFGDLPADLSVRNFFQSSVGLDASLNACVPDLYEGWTPEIIIPQDADEIQPMMAYRENLADGQQVRILSGPALGQQGEIIELSEGKKQIENGLAVFAATIRLRDGKIVSVPQQNLAIIG